jgi:hypothetical protein
LWRSTKLLRAQPAPVLIAKRAVLPTIGLARFVLLPQQRARDPGTAKLGVQLRKIDLRHTRQWHLAPIQPLVERQLIEPRSQRPADARLPTALQALLHGGARAAHHCGDLAIA